jgi:pimeloyl-ACP methyl ester carboxylesterase
MLGDSGSRAVAFRSLDGLHLSGTLVIPSTGAGVATVLVHGGGVTRDEGGFFTRLAATLAEAGMPSLRFDFRAHGDSEGRQEDLTLSGVVNDVRAAVERIRQETSDRAVNLIGTSFGGGLCAFFAAHYPHQVRRLVLLNPLLNYKRRFVDDKSYWHHDQIDEWMGRELAENGFVAHSPSLKLGRALLNEVFYVEPHRVLGEITAPTLFVHGTRDTFIPVDSSREATEQVGDARLVEIEGAQHGRYTTLASCGSRRSSASSSSQRAARSLGASKAPVLVFGPTLGRHGR